MKITIHKNEIEISRIADFNLKKTFECGQCFRWDADKNGSYTGVAFNRVIKARSCNDSIYLSCNEDELESIWRNYFDLDRDYAAIREQLCIDDFMQKATDYGMGIRILRQDKWEALCSFIISQNNNIPRIKSIINSLCREYGDEIKFEGNKYYSFPSSDILAYLTPEKLAPLRCGYRAEYIIRSAKAISGGEINLDALTACDPDYTRAELKKLYGVGDKVADCVMLFGLHMLGAFPLDVWMKRAVAKHYGSGFDPNIFSPYAGIAQQYIFHYTRNTTF
ncbi:MAG: DNA-3-methyladenine glycosylase 2 family protein [Oscillospiraceae bacterium]|nr:DNA-3-methyladenine glycosylase 2 family protein [Oscillospiraceae bacterium]